VRQKASLRYEGEQLIGWIFVIYIYIILESPSTDFFEGNKLLIERPSNFTRKP